MKDKPILISFTIIMLFFSSLLIFPVISINNTVLHEVSHYPIDVAIFTENRENEIANISKLIGFIHGENYEITFNGYLMSDILQINSASSANSSFNSFNSIKFTTAEDQVESYFPKTDGFQNYPDQDALLFVSENYDQANVSLSNEDLSNAMSFHLISSPVLHGNNSVFYVPNSLSIIQVMFEYSSQFSLLIDIPHGEFQGLSIDKVEDYLVEVNNQIEEYLIRSLFTEDGIIQQSISLDKLRQDKLTLIDENIRILTLLIPILQLLTVIYFIVITQRYLEKSTERELFWAKGATMRQILEFQLKDNLISKVAISIFTVILLWLILSILGIPDTVKFWSSFILGTISLLLTISYVLTNWIAMAIGNLEFSINKDFIQFNNNMVIIGSTLIIFVASAIDLYFTNISGTNLIFGFSIPDSYIDNLQRISLALIVISLINKKGEWMQKIHIPRASPKDIWKAIIKHKKHLNITIPIILVLFVSTFLTISINTEIQHYDYNQTEETYYFSDKTYQYSYFPSELISMIEDSPIVEEFGLLHSFSQEEFLLSDGSLADLTYIHNIDFFINNYNFHEDHFYNQNEDLLIGLMKPATMIIDYNHNHADQSIVKLQQYNDTEGGYVTTTNDIIGKSKYKLHRIDTPSFYVTNSTIQVDQITDKTIGTLYVNFLPFTSDSQIEDFNNILQNSIGYDGFFQEQTPNQDAYISIEENKKLLEKVFLLILLLLPLTVFGILEIRKTEDRKRLRLLWDKGVTGGIIKINTLQYNSVAMLYDLLITALLSLLIFLVLRHQNTNFMGMFPPMGFGRLFTHLFTRLGLPIFAVSLVVNFHQIYSIKEVTK